MADRILNRAFFTINIKLRTKGNKREASRDEYLQIIRALHSGKVYKPSSNGKNCIINSLYEKKENELVLYLYGTITQFTQIEKGNWFDLNELNVDTNFKLRDGLFPNAVETEFIFDPDNHKFSFLTKSSIAISPYPVRDFLEKALEQVIGTDGHIHVDVITSSAFLSKLKSATEIRKLEIEVNYSNSGIGSISKELIDNDLRKTNAKNASLTITAKKNESIDVDNSELVKGALELSQEDGEARAKIIDESGNLVEVNTKKFPKKEFFSSNSTFLFENLFGKIRQIWPLRNN